MKSSSRAPAAASGETKSPGAVQPEVIALLVRRHLGVGWWTLLIFLTAGLALEVLHGFKVGAYLNVASETRRLMWTLAHAHGTLLGLVNLGFATTVRLLPRWPEQGKHFASRSLLAATAMMPSGFFLGGLFHYAGDPGLGILLVPLGGILLFVSVLLTALSLKHFSIDPS
jgi:hypothetical protein